MATTHRPAKKPEGCRGGRGAAWEWKVGISVGGGRKACGVPRTGLQRSPQGAGVGDGLGSAGGIQQGGGGRKAWGGESRSPRTGLRRGLQGAGGRPREWRTGVEGRDSSWIQDVGSGDAGRGRGVGLEGVEVESGIYIRACRTACKVQGLAGSWGIGMEGQGWGGVLQGVGYGSLGPRARPAKQPAGCRRGWTASGQSDQYHYLWYMVLTLIPALYDHS